MSNDYESRIAGVRKILDDMAFIEHKELGADDWRVSDEAETDEERRMLGGYTDVWIERPRPKGGTDRYGPKPRVAGVRVHPASGPSYQALLPSGRPRSPLSWPAAAMPWPGRSRSCRSSLP